jgi:hypothetical protein
MNNVAKGVNNKLGSQFDFLAPNSIMSPDYKPRTYSVNSANCWGATPVAFDDSKNRFNWEEKAMKKDDNVRKYSNLPNEFKNKILKIFKSENNVKLAPVARKNTIIDQPSTNLVKFSPNW